MTHISSEPIYRTALINYVTDALFKTMVDAAVLVIEEHNGHQFSEAEKLEVTKVAAVALVIAFKTPEVLGV